MGFAPILASSCAKATTAREAKFRIDIPIPGRRGTRVIALDDTAATIVRRTASSPWGAARFFTLEVGVAGTYESPQLIDATGQPDIALRRTDGTTSTLSDEVKDADVVIMVAAGRADTAAAEAIGRACARRGIMTAGLALGERHRLSDTVLALRPHAQILLVTGEEEDLTELLTALRA